MLCGVVRIKMQVLVGLHVDICIRQGGDASVQEGNGLFLLTTEARSIVN